LEEFNGQIAFDFIVTKNGDIYPIECNPRATSGIHLFNEYRGLDKAFFNLNNEMIVPDKNTKMALSLAMISYGLSYIHSFESLGRWLDTLISSKDVSFSFDDPLPFFSQVQSLYELWNISKQNNISLLEASTFDIEWNGDE
jgi:hypothetical protein